MPVIDVLIVCYNGKAVIDDCLHSVLSSLDPGIITRVTVVDNASSDGTGTYVASKYSDVTLVRSKENLGFAGGNNLGWSHIKTLRPASDFVFLLNQDTIVQSGFLSTMFDFMDAHPNAGAAQSKILLHPATDTINTVGNRSHFLGFGLMTGYLEVDKGQYDSPKMINFASGAATIVRTALLKKFGLFDDVFFMYLEDADLSWKLKQLGFDTWYCPESVVFHKYRFSSDFKHYFYLERNRWWMLLVYYRVGTLMVLLPALAVMELGQWYFAWSKKVLIQKWNSYQWFWKLANLKRLLAARREAQARRVMLDREFIRDFTGVVKLPQLDSPILKFVVNPVFNLYFRLVRCLIWW